MSFPIQTLVVNPVGEEKHTVGPLDAQVRLVNTDGTDFSAGSRLTSCRRPARTPSARSSGSHPNRRLGTSMTISPSSRSCSDQGRIRQTRHGFNTLAKQFNDLVAGFEASGMIKLPEKK